jgi:hypothetical protein
MRCPTSRCSAKTPPPLFTNFPDAISNVDGRSNYVRVQVLTTGLIASAPGAPPPPDRIWVLLTEAVYGGWRLCGHAHMNTELVQAARTALAQSVETSAAAEA